MVSDGYMVWMKTAVFEKICNFVADYFFIWNYLGLGKYVLRLMILKFLKKF
jgi:hypothetical protein